MSQTDLSVSSPRPRVPQGQPARSYRCTNCGLIAEPAPSAPAACRECGHTGFVAAAADAP